MRQQTFDYDIEKLYGYALEREYENNRPKRTREDSTRLKLFWDYRYRNNSYKARKAGIQPCSVMMKFGNDKFRLYGEPENNKLFDKAKVILAGWKARSKADIRAEKLRVKLAKKNKGVSNGI